MRAQMPAFDSIQEFEQALADRLYDGATLWNLPTRDREAGAIYLLGYAAEIALKCAYFRVDGFSIVQPIGAMELKTAVSKSKALGVTTPPESYHSVKFWSDALVALRAANSKPFAAGFVAMLVAAVGAIYDRWWIEMRYKRGYAKPIDTDQVATAVSWIEQNYKSLYT